MPLLDPDTDLSHDSVSHALLQQRPIIESMLHHPACQALQGLAGLVLHGRYITVETRVDTSKSSGFQRRLSDMAWVLTGKGRRVLLIVEHQSTDADMSLRMLEYAKNAFHAHGESLQVSTFPLLFYTGRKSSRGWWMPRTDSRQGDDWFWKAGPIVDVNDFPLQDMYADSENLPRPNLFSGIIALHQLYWKLQESEDLVESYGYYNMIVEVAKVWLKPCLAEEDGELGRIFAIWIAIGMKDFLQGYPQGQTTLDHLSTLDFGKLEANMIGLQEVVDGMWKDGHAKGHVKGHVKGYREGHVEGQLDILTDFVARHWGAEVSVQFRARLEQDPGIQYPDLNTLYGRLDAGHAPLPDDLGSLGRR